MTLHEVLRKHGIDPDTVWCGAYAPDGWVPLIDELITDLIAMGWDKDLRQVKSKFGGLRFYVGGPGCTDEMADRIARAEGDSFHIKRA